MLYVVATAAMFLISLASCSQLCMYEEIISKLGPIFEKNISSSLAEIDFEREVRRRAMPGVLRAFRASVCCSVWHIVLIPLQLQVDRLFQKLMKRCSRL